MSTDCRGPLSILLITSDLMVSSRIAGAAAAIPATVASLGPAAEPGNGPFDVIVVDLEAGRRGAGELVGRAREIAASQAALRPAAIVAFGPHVAVDRLAEAKAAGADLVVTRGEALQSLAAVVNRVRSLAATRRAPSSDGPAD